MMIAAPNPTAWLSLGLLACLLGGCGGPGPTQLSYWENVRSPEGWSGRRYTENGKVVVEEFDAVGKDDVMDFWRYYQKGRLLNEEHDRDSDGRIDFIARHDPRTGAIVTLVRDTDFDGRTDLWVDFDGTDLWTKSRDSNGDGVVDMLFLFRGPKEMLARPGMDLYETTDFRSRIDKIHWVELAIDEDLDDRFDSWVRYEEGRVVARGAGLGRGGRPARWIPVTGTRRPAVSRPAGEYTRIDQVRPGSAMELREQAALERGGMQRPRAEATARVSRLEETDMPEASRSPADEHEPNYQGPEHATEPTTRKGGFFAGLRRFFRSRSEDGSADAPSEGEGEDEPDSSPGDPEVIYPEGAGSSELEAGRLEARPRARVRYSEGVPAPLPPSDIGREHPSSGLER